MSAADMQDATGPRNGQVWVNDSLITWVLPQRVSGYPPEAGRT